MLLGPIFEALMRQDIHRSMISKLFWWWPLVWSSSDYSVRGKWWSGVAKQSVNMRWWWTVSSWLGSGEWAESRTSCCGRSLFVYGDACCQTYFVVVNFHHGGRTIGSEQSSMFLEKIWKAFLFLTVWLPIVLVGLALGKVEEGRRKNNTRRKNKESNLPQWDIPFCKWVKKWWRHTESYPFKKYYT